MHFVLQTPSLQHLVEVKIVAELWSGRDVFTQISESLNGTSCYPLRENTKNWKAMEDKVRRKVWALSLPTSCKRQLLNLVKPLGMEIIRWCRYHNLDRYDFQFLDISLPKQLFWSMHGTVDYEKTAKLMVKDERVDVEKRYIIACFHCLEDEARQLIEHIPEEQRLKFVKGGSFEKVEQQTMIAFCTRTLLGCSDGDQLNREFHLDSFKMTLYGGTRATCEYLFAKLSREEKEQVFVEYPGSAFQRNSDIGSPTCNSMHYLSLLTKKQQESMFLECIYKLLIFLLRWPLQSLFLNAAERGWQLMDKRECAEMLYAITRKIKDGSRDYDYCQLFWECWALSSADYQQHFLNSYNLEGLFATKREEFISLVFNEAPAHQLNKFVGCSYDEMYQPLLDESVISDATLMEWKEKAALISSKDRDNAEKRLRSQHLRRIVDMEVERRRKRRRL